MYEGLLDHGAERVDDVYVGLIGKPGDEAEIPLADLEKAAGKGKKQLIAFLVEKIKRREGAVEKILASSHDVVSGKDPEMRRLLNTACENKKDLSAECCMMTPVDRQLKALEEAALRLQNSREESLPKLARDTYGVDHTPSRRVIAVRASTIAPYARGEATWIEGCTTSGKTMALLALAARITRGDAFATGERFQRGASQF